MSIVHEKRCFNTCLMCEDQISYYVNFCEFHGVCGMHAINLPASCQCRICESSVLLVRAVEISCNYCKRPGIMNMFQCGHIVCKGCQLENQCCICIPRCCECNQPSNFIYETCGHHFCTTCRGSNVRMCPKCYFSSCKICKVRIQDSEEYCSTCFNKCSNCGLENELPYKFGCEHLHCTACMKIVHIKCVACNKTFCKKCKKGSKALKAFGCKHFVCADCKNEYWKDCPYCGNAGKFTCEKCREISVLMDCHKKKHKLCSNCDGKYCPLCQYWCCNCNNRIDFLNINQYKCGHDICKGCLDNPNSKCNKCDLLNRNTVTCAYCYHVFDRVSYEVIKTECRECKKTICLACGGKFSLFGAHECKLS